MVIGQADKQWMHRPGPEPPIAQGPLYPLSRAFEPGYTAASLEGSRRRVATAKYLDKVKHKQLLNDIAVVRVGVRSAP